MNHIQEQAISSIEQQQENLDCFTAPWIVGEQLKDICKRGPNSAELIAHDLTVPDMSLAAAEKKIKAWADKQKKAGNSVCVPPNKAEEIIREFYGLSGPGEQPVVAGGGSGVNLDLADFL